MKNNFKILTITFFQSDLCILQIFIFLKITIIQQFWCVEVIKNFELGNFKNIRLPIHCDEGPYRFASTSLDNFFDKSNPQGRPLFVGLVGLFRFLFELFFSFSEYQNLNYLCFPFSI